MNYLKHYNLLISKSKERILEGYVEKHHIVPRCMGGSNERENIAQLTPEEHYIAHLLLIKIYPKEPKLIYAVKMMGSSSKNHKRKPRKLVGWLKRKYAEDSKNIEKTWTQRNPRKQRAKETKPRKKRTLSNEHKEKIGKSQLGRKRSEETKLKMHLAQVGKTLTEDHKLALRKPKKKRS